MKLSSLIKNIDCKSIYGSESVDVASVVDNSRKVKKDSLFVAISGISVDAHKFIPEAIKKGATAVVGEKNPKKEWLSEVTYIKVKNSREALGLLASAWYGYPSKKMKVIGVTGTDGKTTTATLVYHIFKTANKKVGLISTVSAIIGEKEYDTGFHVTNPEPLELHNFLAKMVDSGCECVVLEVTSHGLDQERVAGIDFDISVLTNVTHEHLDYHKTYDNYLKTKAKLFLSSNISVLNKDDESFDKINKILKGKTEIVKYEKEMESRQISDAINQKFIEDYNQSNAAAASTVAQRLGISDKEIIKAIKTFKGIEGRMEEIKNNRGFKIYVDFAHTPNALKNVLTSLSKQTKGRLIVVYGCASERDVEKRKLMPEISTDLADISIYTAEDPRKEDINDILATMAKYAKKSGAQEIKLSVKGIKSMPDKSFVCIPERGEAIAFAINKLAKKGDVVAICGKGHEKTMNYDGVEHPWSDKEVVLSCLSVDKKKCAIVMAGGAGTRLGSTKPKVINKIAGRPMIAYTLNNLRKAGFGKIVVVVSFKKEEVIRDVGPAVDYAVQLKPLGTGHAAFQGFRVLEKTINNALVLNGDDSAFYSPETLCKMYDKHVESESDMTFATVIINNSKMCGRVIRDVDGQVLGVVEVPDLTESQKEIKENNCGTYAYNSRWFRNSFRKIKKSSKGEYYITDLTAIAVKQNDKVSTYKMPKDEWHGVNTKEELEKADKLMREKVKKTYGAK